MSAECYQLDQSILIPYITPLETNMNPIRLVHFMSRHMVDVIHIKLEAVLHMTPLLHKNAPVNFNKSQVSLRVCEHIALLPMAWQIHGLLMHRCLMLHVNSFTPSDIRMHQRQKHLVALRLSAIPYFSKIHDIQGQMYYKVQNLYFS